MALYNMRKPQKLQNVQTQPFSETIHLSESEAVDKESIYWKKSLTTIAHQPQNPLDGSNQILAMTSSKKETSQWPPRSLYSSLNAMLCYCCWKDISNSITVIKSILAYSWNKVSRAARGRTASATPFSLAWPWGLNIARPYRPDSQAHLCSKHWSC